LNLILFDTAAAEATLAPEDPRGSHLRDILRLRPGDQFDVGVVNGPHGKATLLADDAAGTKLSFSWQETVTSDLLPLRLLSGLPRPQTARKILQQASALGVSSIEFFGADKGEPSYADSKLWTTEEWRRHVVQGVEQAFCCFLPEIRLAKDLESALGQMVSDGATRLALDVYESDAPLTPSAANGTDPISLAVGPERGWSARERDLLRQAEFRFHHLGERVLRQESACVAALGVLASRWW
jgi:16S rRNA (uracil1498-N3)-methyltransferase